MRTLSKIQVSIVVLVLVVTVPVVSYAVDGKIKIGQTPSTTFPIVIDASGSYVLTSNLQVSTNFNCIQIAADNVTLDLNGFALIGPGTGSAGSGIYVGSNNNITIMNGTVRDFRSSGIYFLSGAKNQLKDLRCINNGQAGIDVEQATVVNCITEDNATNGIKADYSTVRDCTSNNNSDDGIGVVSSTVLNCQIFSNNNRGIYSRHSTITSCTITGNFRDGIEAYDTTITNCTSYGNVPFGAGIQVNDSTVTNCVATGNGLSGFKVTNSTITNCTANANNYYGFNVVSESSVTNCTANNNHYSGIIIGSPGKSRIAGNNLRSNGQSQTSGFGINILLESDNNYVIKNTASDNFDGNFIDDGPNNYMPLTGDNRNYSF